MRASPLSKLTNNTRAVTGKLNKRSQVCYIDRARAGGHRRTRLGSRTSPLRIPVQQVVFQDYVEACHEATRHVTDLDDQIGAAAVSLSFAPVVKALINLRGINVLSAVTVLTERGDITRTGNGHVRRWWKPPGTIAFRPARHGISMRRPRPPRMGADPRMDGAKTSVRPLP